MFFLCGIYNVTNSVNSLVTMYDYELSSLKLRYQRLLVL